LCPKPVDLRTFEFLTDRLPFGYAYNFDNYLFNKIQHINTQEIDKRADYFIANNVKKWIEGKIHFLLDQGIAYSPYKSLFGSFEFNPRIHPKLLAEFWKYIENDLIARGIKQVKITSYAECYAPKKSQLIHSTLLQAGFQVLLKAVNHHIDVSKAQLQERMHPMEIRRLIKCKKAGFKFNRENAARAGEIYDYIKRCRIEKGIEISISKKKLMDYFSEFDPFYQLFTVTDRSHILAATIAINVQRRILYSFLPASLKKYNEFSPSVMLNAGMYEYCQKSQIHQLDLGISTESDGRDQSSLIAFKERMGGEKSYKYFYQKNL
jgi:hypothetical protein